jgi:hypothetical protein
MNHSSLMVDRRRPISFLLLVSRRHRGREVRAAAVHPGGIQTELGRYMAPSRLQAIADLINKQLAVEGKPPFQWKTIPQGAATSVWAAVDAPADEIGGRYCANCQIGNIVPDDAVITTVSEGVRAYARDPNTAEKLWEKVKRCSESRFRPKFEVLAPE